MLHHIYTVGGTVVFTTALGPTWPERRICSVVGCTYQNVSCASSKAHMFNKTYWKLIIKGIIDSGIPRVNSSEYMSHSCVIRCSSCKLNACLQCHSTVYLSNYTIFTRTIKLIKSSCQNYHCITYQKTHYSCLD